MNKYLGFYELKAIGIPTVKWEEFNNNILLNKNKLWTLRTAVLNGHDLSLPRAVGITSEEAYQFYNKLINENKINENYMVVYYPYFIANKSGTLQIEKEKTLVEAVNKDLWNLVDKGELDVSICINDDKEETLKGNRSFFRNDEWNELIKAQKVVKSHFGKEIYKGAKYLLEWSFANDTDKNKKPIGDEYLVFYECREIN